MTLAKLLRIVVSYCPTLMIIQIIIGSLPSDNSFIVKAFKMCVWQTGYMLPVRHPASPTPFMVHFHHMVRVGSVCKSAARVAIPPPKVGLTRTELY